MTGGSYTRLDVASLLSRMPEVAQYLRPSAPPVSEPEHGNRPPEIFRAAYGPETVSTSKALVPMTAVPIFDVNGYYRALGISWPFRPTKTELRKAYVRRHGSDSEYLTYCFHRLLDKDFRANYDARPMGKPVDDIYRWLQVRREGARWAAKETLRTGRAHGLKDFVGDIADRMATDQQPKQDMGPMEAVEGFMWSYGYYLWGSRHRDEAALSEWQRMLVDAMWERGLWAQLAVGYVGHLPAPAVRVRRNQTTIIFLRDTDFPTPDLADAVAETFLITPPNSPVTTPILISPNRATPSERRTPTVTELLDFASGGQQAQELQKAEAAARKARYGNQKYLTSILVNDGDITYLRFLIDEPLWIHTKQHGFVKTKAAPRDKPADRDWPATTGAVCRYTLLGQPPNQRPAFNDCYICDAMRDEKGKSYFPGLKIWTLAAIREPVLGTQEMVDAGQIQPYQLNQRVSMRDVTVEVDELDKDGKPVMGADGKPKRRHQKQIVIVNMAITNFFSPLLTLSKLYGTALDRDYMIVRKGEAKAQKVVYDAAPIDVLMAPDPNDPSSVVPFDLRNPAFMAYYEQDSMGREGLLKLISNRISKDYYDRFFDPRVEVSWKSDDDEDTTTTAATSETVQSGQSSTAEPTSGPTAEQLASMRARVMEQNPQTQPAASPGMTYIPS